MPEGVDLAPFAAMVEQVKETLKEFELTDKMPRRAGYHFYHRSSKPRRKRQPKEVVDDDGWTSMVPKKHAQSAAQEAAEEERAAEEIEREQVRSFHTSAAKISSGKTGIADSKDTVAIAHVSRFNAFDALNADDDD